LAVVKLEVQEAGRALRQAAEQPDQEQEFAPGRKVARGHEATAAARPSGVGGWERLRRSWLCSALEPELELESELAPERGPGPGPGPVLGARPGEQC
jgi:hypothetical protein